MLWTYKHKRLLTLDCKCASLGHKYRDFFQVFLIFKFFQNSNEWNECVICLPIQNQRKDIVFSFFERNKTKDFTAVNLNERHATDVLKVVSAWFSLPARVIMNRWESLKGPSLT